MRALLFPLVLAAVGSKAGEAQSPLVQPSTRIRVSFDCQERLAGDAGRSGCQRQRGTLIELDSAGMTWQADPASPAGHRPWSAIRSVEVRRGRHGHAGTGAAVGAVVAAIPGALSGMAAAEALCEGCARPNYAGGAVVGALIFAGPGALAGAIIGQLVRTERWEPVPLERLRVTALPGARTFGVGINLTF